MTPRRIPILRYHSISRTSSKAFRRAVVDPEQFEHHMRQIVRSGYHAMTISDLTDRIKAGANVRPRTVAITFDGAFADFSTEALPILERHGLTATVYVPTAYVGATAMWLRRQGEDRRPLMTAEQLQAASRNGIEIGANGHTHISLDVLNAAAVRAELTRSRDVLDSLGLSSRSLAFPYGHTTRAVRALAVEAGFSSACGVRHAMTSPRDDLYGLARIVIADTTGTAGLDAHLRGVDLPTAPFEEPLRTRAWREIRRAAHVLRRTPHGERPVPVAG